MHGLVQQLLEFHKKFSRPIGDLKDPDFTVEQALRIELIEEEFNELLVALDAHDLEQVADALGDLVYVIAGAAVAWGIDLGTIIDVIHASNMTKTPGNLREDGKVLKGPDFVPPDIKGALELQAYEIDQDGYGDDSWWPVPTSYRLQEDTEIPQEVTDKIMLAAKDQAKILAMKNIKKDFVPSKDFEEEEPTNDFLRCEKIADGLKGTMTPYGCFVFDCPCSRRHAIQAKLGSRGGMATTGQAECMCGRAFTVDFNQGEPKITVTTIEELKLRGSLAE